MRNNLLILALALAALVLLGRKIEHLQQAAQEVPVVWVGDKPYCPEGYSATAEQADDDHDTAICSKP